MRLIVGLGNPGTKYINTRHNIGFKAVDEFARRQDSSLRKKIFGSAKENLVTFRGKRVLLLEPLTFMNLSGDCVLGYTRKFKIAAENILIIYDDVSIPLGTIRIRAQGSAGGHNGLQSVLTRLGTDTVPRLRIGVGAENPPADLSRYVLSDFTKKEIPHAGESVRHAADACECWITEGIDKAMSIFNSI